MHKQSSRFRLRNTNPAFSFWHKWPEKNLWSKISLGCLLKIIIIIGQMYCNTISTCNDVSKNQIRTAQIFSWKINMLQKFSYLLCQFHFYFQASFTCSTLSGFSLVFGRFWTFLTGFKKNYSFSSYHSRYLSQILGTVNINSPSSI